MHAEFELGANPASHSAKSSNRGKITMRTFSILLLAALAASATAQDPPPCEDQPIYDGDCPVFTDEDCTEEGKRYRVACEFKIISVYLSYHPFLFLSLTYLV